MAKPIRKYKPRGRRAKRSKPKLGELIKEKSSVTIERIGAPTKTKPITTQGSITRISELRRNKVITLHLYGFTTSEIADRCEISTESVRIIVCKAEQDTPKIGRDIIIAHVADRFINIIHNHKHTNIELYTSMTDLQSARDTLRQVLKSTIQAVEAGSKAAVVELRVQTRALSDLIGQIADLARDLTRNDKDFVDMVTRMGVPDAPIPDNDGVPTQPGLKSNLTYSEDQDKKSRDIIDEIKIGNQRQLEWLKKQESQV